ncbi:hypothetical protein I4J32_04150 [Corynebacterium diphtheriae bv. mitis]|uniref:YkvI family membrane protein n=1 Tax=Corynebacterium diphtheriae TaxID=1717 RepID=UPI0013C7628D|nr:hypothetical protein [Corynebacterium diphtheriae]MBG9312401.1 hypothetical protein [Corynebacterium diphtheriae bv. mitis]CAB0499685.1 membrane protein [Corynebacterium diphtheriae]CAB0500315.1 membrane protein [Corynebacterium diphtheriae]CAB0641984.1 membrane protein [Corynebacterium diphtheriae]CAB0810441.1 membrane protein [Corynebacterium diphtheriae]
MLKKTITIAMAFVGIVIGAGFATGQEVLQYFVSFGMMGIFGAALSAVIMTVTGMASIQLGSYFLANDHGSVLRRISHPIVARILDVAVLITLFATGVVMLAGSGSNLNQQFGWPAWAGSLLMLVLVMVAGLLDVDKLTAVIGSITPLIIIFVIVAIVYALSTSSADIGTLNQAAATINSATPHWALASLNYVGLALMMGVSMAIIIGGNNVDPRAAGLGGLTGGVIYGVMLTFTALALYRVADKVAADDVPMLTIINEIHPILGTVMSLVIVGMIFNTALGMFYAFAKRATSSRRALFYPVYLIASALGFAASFLGFKKLVGVVYPALGYLGILLVVVVAVAWLRGFAKIRDERARRDKIHNLIKRKLDPTKRFSSKQQRQLDRLTRESNLKPSELKETIREEVVEELAGAADGDDVDAVIDEAAGITTTYEPIEFEDTTVSVEDTSLGLPSHARPMSELEDLTTFEEDIAEEAATNTPADKPAAKQ